MTKSPLIYALIFTFAIAQSLSIAQEPDPQINDKIDVLQLDGVDDELITGSILRENQTFNYCINISDAATETRNSILRKGLNSIEARVDQKLVKLAARIEELRSWTLRRERFLKTGNESLVSIFQSMRSDAAALQLTELGPVLAASIIFKLEPKVSSAILTEMKPAYAAKIATVLTSAVEADDPDSQ